MQDQTFLDIAARFHHALPARIRTYLKETRGIPDEVIDAELLGWNGARITIPIFNRDGEVAFFKLARDPENPADGPKMLATPGGRAELYGWGSLITRPKRLIICEGEFDRLVLEGRGFPAVTSTAGALTFRPEWAAHVESIPEIYICFDRDEPGREGGARVARLIPHARIVELPEEVGAGGDVTDFFVRLGRTAQDFEALLETAKPSVPSEPPPAPEPPQAKAAVSPMRERIERAKASVALEELVGRYVDLEGSGMRLTGLCPFHSDHNPSLVVYPRSGTFICFGCGRRGDAITFLREIEHVSFPEALERLEAFAHHHGRSSDQAA